MKHLEQNCPVAQVALLLSDTWTMLIMRDINDGPKRFCEIERSLEGISTRTLTLKLKKLTAEGLIRKSAEGIYSSTERGRGLKIIESAMRRYGERFLK